MKRRAFLKTSAAATSSALISGGAVSAVLGSTTAMAAGPGNKWPGRVAINFNKNAASGSTANAATIAQMVDDSIKLLTGESSVGAAWKAVFPSTLTAASTIAIKVPLGCAIETIAPHWSSVKAITDGLQQMDFNGTKFPATNITIYEMNCSNKFTAYGYTAARFGSVKIVYDSEGNYTDGANGVKYATSLRKDFLINVFRPGGHASTYSGFTLGFKNHYGTYPADHGNTTAQPYLRDINCTGPVFQKNVLSVCVGIFGAEEASGSPGSPKYGYTTYAQTMDPTVSGADLPPTTIIMSTDPISAEMQTIKMMRINNGKGYTVNDMPKYLRASAGIDAGISGTTKNIGIIDESQMEIRRIINGSATATKYANKKAMSGTTITVSPVQNQRSAFIEFSVPSATVGKEAVIKIFDAQGSLVWEKTSTVQGVNNQVSWQNNDSSVRHIRAGMYVVQLTIGAILESAKLIIAR